jgi:competence protein ComEC
MRSLLVLVAAVLAALGPVSAQSGSGTLDIYFIDTEGGQATLYVTPAGESVLVDTGNPGTRDADRIMAVLGEAGVRQLDHVVLTHYHVDHIGGLQELARRIPILHFVDHGPSVEENEQVPGFQAAYADLHARARRTVARPGDRLPIAGVDWRIVASAGSVLRSPLEGAGGANPTCAEFRPQEITRDLENAQSVGSVVSHGRFRTLNLGDLLWNLEYELMCPVNRVGTVDLYITSHHGLGQSGSPQLVHAIRPRVAVMNNGMRKGGAVAAFQTIHSSPGIEDVWQLHWSHHAGIEFNSPGAFIANVDEPAVIASVVNPAPPVAGAPAGPASPPPPHAGDAHWIKVSAQADGSFTVTNSRTGFTKTYAARR